MLQPVWHGCVTQYQVPAKRSHPQTNGNCEALALGRSGAMCERMSLHGTSTQRERHSARAHGSATTHPRRRRSSSCSGGARHPSMVATSETAHNRLASSLLHISDGLRLSVDTRRSVSGLSSHGASTWQALLLTFYRRR